MELRLTEFSKRQWEEGYIGSKMTGSIQEFEKKINELFQQNKELHDGYAPFCKHIFVENFLENIEVGALEITEDNKSLLNSDYVSRREEELPVLSRWFNKKDFKNIPQAEILDIILYSKEQVDKENEATSQTDLKGENYSWGIVAIKGQNQKFELPMTPITMLRNALGKEEGGSGVLLDRAKYQESVNYWKKHAMLS